VPGPGSFDWVTLMQEQMFCCFVCVCCIHLWDANICHTQSKQFSQLLWWLVCWGL